jgi:hypothetical protein
MYNSQLRPPLGQPADSSDAPTLSRSWYRLCAHLDLPLGSHEVIEARRVRATDNTDTYEVRRRTCHDTDSKCRRALLCGEHWEHIQLTLGRWNDLAFGDNSTSVPVQLWPGRAGGQACLFIRQTPKDPAPTDPAPAPTVSLPAQATYAAPVPA